MRTQQIFQHNFTQKQLLHWAENEEVFVLLDSNHYPFQSQSFDYIIALGIEKEINLSEEKDVFQNLENFQQDTKDWLFGYFSYDLKNDVEPSLFSKNQDNLNFPALYFFQPKKILFIKNQQITFSYLEKYKSEIVADFNTIQKIKTSESTLQRIDLQGKTTPEEYIQNVKKIQQKIQHGEVYEVNYCIEFFQKNTEINPLETFAQLNAQSKTPFASFFKIHQHYIISASPERFLQKIDNQIIAQPIKGTRKRGKTKEEDQKLIKDLQSSEKELAENIMIVDLVRNDLSKIATKNSVKVKELCKVYSFEKIHQMTSTVTCEVLSEISPIQIIKQNFPMGSMTGAPKISAMKIIDKIENHKRSVYSGALGYFTPNSDFDFNVIIRTLLYNTDKQYLSISVGSAITALSNPKEEYDECITKVQSVANLF